MNRLFFTISLVGIGTVATLLNSASQINAQDLNAGEVEMTATIEGFCIFENQLDGTLGVSPDDLSTLDSTEGANNITASDGAAGSIDVTCNDPTYTINVDTVTETNTAGATINTFTTTVSGLASDLTSTNGAAGTPVAVGSTNTETLEIYLAATYEDNLNPGDYSFIVNLVANP